MKHLLATFCPRLKRFHQQNFINTTAITFTLFYISMTQEGEREKKNKPTNTRLLQRVHDDVDDSEPGVDFRESVEGRLA